MGTTTLLVLRDLLQTAIGDKNLVYADNYTDAIVNAIKEVYPNLFKPLEDTSLTTGASDYEYELPSDFQNGVVSQVFIKVSGDETDLDDAVWHKVYGWGIIDDGTAKDLRLPALYTADRKIRLIGYCPLETLSLDTSTISLDGERLNLLIAYAAYLLFEMEKGVPASGDVERIERQAAYWWNKYRSLSHLSMPKPSSTMNLPNW